MFALSACSFIAFSMRDQLVKQDYLIVIVLALLFSSSATYFATGLKGFAPAREGTAQVQIDSLSSTNSYLSGYIDYQINQINAYQENSEILQTKIASELLKNSDADESSAAALQSSLSQAQTQLKSYKDLVEKYQEALDEYEDELEAANDRYEECLDSCYEEEDD
jgi:flagellar motility protein MotE (MotC chaperone)